MNFLFRLITLLTIILVSSCSKNNKEISVIKEINQEDEMILAYKEGTIALERGDPFFAQAFRIRIANIIINLDKKFI